MHRTAACLTALILAGCARELPRLPAASLKDSPARPDVAPSVVVYTGIGKIAVEGTDQATASRIRAALLHSLNAQSHTVNDTGNWSITGKVTSQDTVMWTIKDAASRTVGTFTQSGLSTAATLAIAPGVSSFLPVPRVSL